MAEPQKYPLEQVISIKQKRFDQAVKTLEIKKEILEKAYERLYDLNEEKTKVQEHKKSKLTQLREGLDQGISTDKIQQMKFYLKTVEEKLLEHQKKVDAQQKVVDQAQTEVDKATDDLFQKKKDLEKMEIHKKEWNKEEAYLVERKEEVEHDEQGSATHERVKRERKKQKDGSK